MKRKMRSRYVPHQNSFDVVRLLAKLQFWVLLCATLLSIVAFGLHVGSINNHESWITFTTSLSSIFAVSYLILEIVINTKFYNAGCEKRLDMIDHAFDSLLSGDKSINYFNPGTIGNGVYKLGVLSFENSLFTSKIAQKELFGKWILVILVSATFLASAAFGNRVLVNLLIQLTMTGVVFINAIKFQQFSNRMDKIHSSFKEVFNDLKHESDKSKKEALLIKNILDYESTHAWGGILLSSRKFRKMNAELSKKWEGLKEAYNIS